MATIEVRKAHAGDEAALVELRAEMFRAMDVRADDDVWRENAHTWFETRLTGSAHGIFVVTENDQVVACAMGFVRDAAPSPTSPSGGDVLISNVCTLPAHRGRGHGSAALEAVLVWARGTGAGRAELVATLEGRPMYERNGFETRSAPLMRAQLH
ncbi:GNAT family N-acetyltransferase [Flexivirga sp. B27]